jgi:hypothetical protein|tara:strand:+ start:148 stop:357 length:210 start_codon:yes stop_codon:yes gene_type:complete
MIKQYLIEGKGFYNVMVDDPFFCGVEISDIKTRYNYIEFKGTEKQLDSFLEHLYQDESEFKVIGVHKAI